MQQLYYDVKLTEWDGRVVLCDLASVPPVGQIQSAQVVEDLQGSFEHQRFPGMLHTHVQGYREKLLRFVLKLPIMQ